MPTNQGEKVYEVMPEATAIILALREKYPKILWTVKPEEIVVLCCVNKDRPESQRRLAIICKLGPAEKKLISMLSSSIKYYIEVYLSDWSEWDQPRRQIILLHELTHVPAPWERGLVRHDLEDFSFIVDKFGVSWWGRNDLPDLLAWEPVEFNMVFVDPLHSKREEDENG